MDLRKCLFLLVLLVLLFAFTNNLFAFAGGDGLSGDPFQITTWEHLNNVRNYLGEDYSDSHFKLMNNLDSTTVGYNTYASSTANSDAGWEPIGSGNGANAFQGTFVGDSKTISGIYINRPDSDFVGLFGYTQNSEIKNIGVIDFFITGNNNVGGLVGHNLIGEFIKCYARGNVNGNDITGVLLGQNYWGKIKNSYTAGQVSGNSKIGGLIGWNRNAQIENSYATVYITANSIAGGLIGNNKDATIINSYAIGKTIGSTNVGGLIGLEEGECTTTNSFYDIYTTGQSDAGKGIGLATIDMVDSSVFIDSGWNFTDTWTILPNQSYPFLKWQTSVTPFATAYAIDSALSHAGTGEITISADTQYAGGTILISAATNPGYEFDSWTISPNTGTFANANDSVTIYTIADTNVIITANLISYNGPIWYVDSALGGDTFSGSETYPFKTITYALSQMNAGDTLLIGIGTFSETVVIDKNNLTLIGADTNLTIINLGDSSTNTVKGIYAENKTGLVIKNLQIKNVYTGIYWDTVYNSKIENVYVNHCGQHGISIFSSDTNIIIDNISEYNNITGIFISGSNNTVTDNITNSNLTGITIASSGNNILLNNTVSLNSNYGIDLVMTNNNKAVRNIIFKNNNGVRVISSNNNYFAQNTFDSNTGYAIRLEEVFVATDNTIYNNNFINSDSAVYFEAQSADMKYNYWDTTDSDIINSKINIIFNNSLWIPFRLGAVDSAAGADTVIPASPDTVTVQTLDDTSIKINWSAVTDDINGNTLDGGKLAGYRIYRANIENPTDWGESIAQITNGLEYIDKNLNSFTKYYYKVTAYDTKIPYENESFYSALTACDTTLQLYSEIRITSPQSGIDTHLQTIIISGTKINLLASDTIEIIINNESYEIYEIGNTNLYWDYEIELAIGENIIRARLTSGDSEWEDSIILNYLSLGYEMDLRNTVIVPNPYRLNDGNDLTGLDFTGSTNDIYNRTGIHILKLTDNVKIEIYDILGRRVRTIYNIDGYGRAIWDGKKSNGIDVASGTYLFVISNDFQRKILKMAIIR